MNTLTYQFATGDQFDEKVREYVKALEAESKPYRIVLSKVDSFDIYQVFFHRFPQKGTWMTLDEVGNIWISSKKEGKNYDTIPFSDILELVKKSPLENVLDLIPIKSVSNVTFNPYFYVVSMPVEDKVLTDLLNYDPDRSIIEPVVKLTANRGKTRFTGLAGLYGDFFTDME